MKLQTQTLKLAGREFVILPKRDFQKLAAQAQRQTEDDYWTKAALKAEAQFAASGEKPIPFEQFERDTGEIRLEPHLVARQKIAGDGVGNPDAYRAENRIARDMRAVHCLRNRCEDVDREAVRLWAVQRHEVHAGLHQ